MAHALTIAGGDVTVSGTTALTNGRVITNASTLVANGAVTRTTGYVDGFLQKPVTVGGPVARTFEVGDALAYSPINVTFASVTGAGALTGKATGGDHAQIGSSDLVPSKSVNRNWTVTNSGTTFTTADAVFNFVSGDIDGGRELQQLPGAEVRRAELVGARRRARARPRARRRRASRRSATSRSASCRRKRSPPSAGAGGTINPMAP